MKRKLQVMTTLLIIALIINGLVTAPCTAAEPPSQLQNPQTDSRELQLQDMLVLQLLPYMNDRLNGFRGFDFQITLRAFPTVGPHNSVGEDLFTYRISTSQIKLINYKHLKEPKQHNIPPNDLDMRRKSK